MSDNSLTEPDQELPKQKKIGRPTIFTQDIADEICKRMANGETLRKIVLDEHMPVSSAIYRWLDTNQTFKEQYTQARIKQADYYAEMIVDEAFGSHDAAIGRLRMDALKWAASKIAPKKYGDKVEVEQTGGTALTVSFALPSRSGNPEAIELESGKLPAPHEDRV
jgi:hypothetical protein